MLSLSTFIACMAHFFYEIASRRFVPPAPENEYDGMTLLPARASESPQDRMAAYVQAGRCTLCAVPVKVLYACFPADSIGA
jgi:hypothetical protein